jgi:hypothetical protein
MSEGGGGDISGGEGRRWRARGEGYLTRVQQMGTCGHGVIYGWGCFRTGAGNDRT